MCHKNLRQNLVHLHPGVILAMPDGALVLLLALELEDDGLLTPALCGDGARYPRGADGGTGLNRVSIQHGDYAVEFNCCADVAGQSLDFNRLAWRDAILFTTGFNDCVHTGPLKDFGWKP